MGTKRSPSFCYTYPTMMKLDSYTFPYLVFAVQVAGLIPIYAFRAIQLTQSKLRIITIALKKSPFCFCQLIQTGKVGNWIRVNNLRLGADYSFTHNRDCLVYMFSLRFSGKKFLINLRWQFRVSKIFSCTQNFSYTTFCGI